VTTGSAGWLSQVPLLRQLAEHGIRLDVRTPDNATWQATSCPSLVSVHLRTARAVAAVRAGDHLALAEAYLHGDIDVDGAWRELMRVTDVVALSATPLDRFRLAARLWLRDRQRYDREAIAFHYDRPPEFFLPWLDRWRCYSHGLYTRPDEPLTDAIARKLQAAIDGLGLQPGMQVLDMGGGWGCFVEYAGQRGIRVHSITMSAAQHAFVQRLIAEQGLPCTSELVHLRAYRPPCAFDGAVFMGTFEHNPEYDQVVAFLTRHLAPHARVWADFCAQHTDFTIGGFMKKHIWPGPITYVDPAGLVRAFQHAGFNLHELRDDTRHYACTIRDWGVAFEQHARDLAMQFGEAPIRAFRLFLHGSRHFLEANRTQAYHLVAGRTSAPLPNTGSATPADAGGAVNHPAESPATRRSTADRSPDRASTGHPPAASHALR
jgi:cyclopropane-fatty-acyl-phospholipid synthase